MLSVVQVASDRPLALGFSTQKTVSDCDHTATMSREDFLKATVGRGLAEACRTGLNHLPGGHMAPLELCSSANALFASSLQPSDRPDPAQVRAAITAALGTLGHRGCLARLAQQYGDHPEIAVSRM